MSAVAVPTEEQLAAMDEQRVTDFLMKMAGDAAAAAGGIAVAVGDRLGLYAAMSGAGPMTAADLASKTGLLTITLEQGAEENLRRIAFEVSPHADFADMAKNLSTEGIESQLQHAGMATR